VPSGATAGSSTAILSPVSPRPIRARACAQLVGALGRSATWQPHCAVGYRPGGEARAAAQAPRTAGRRQLVPWLVVILALAIAVIAALLVAK
jgi:hypothetical protein